MHERTKRANARKDAYKNASANERKNERAKERTKQCGSFIDEGQKDASKHIGKQKKQRNTSAREDKRETQLKHIGERRK